MVYMSPDIARISRKIKVPYAYDWEIVSLGEIDISEQLWGGLQSFAFNLQDISKYLWKEVEMCVN